MPLNGRRFGRRLLSRRQRFGVALALACMASACGSQHTHEDLLAAYHEADGAGRASPASGVGSVVVAGDPESQDTQAPDDTSAGTNAGASPGAAGSGTGASSGGSPATDSSPGGTAGAHATCTERRSTISIGTVGEQSGIAGSAVAPGTRAVQAWVAKTNAAGGINCHPIRYIVADDGGDPSNHQALVQKLVEDDGILAIVYMNAVIPGQASVSYLTQKGIPVIGNEGGEAWFYTSPVYFPQQGTGDVALKALVSAAAQIGREARLGTLSCIEAPACSRLSQTGTGYAGQLGMNLVYQGQASIAQPDYTSVCQAAQRAAVQTWIVVLDPNSMSRVGRSCATVGYHPQYIVYGGSSNLQTGTDPNLNGVVVGMPTIPWFITSNPGVAEFVDALARYAPGVQPEPITITGWVAAKLFIRATRNLPEPPTSQGILEGLWSVQGEDLGGMTQPLTFTRGQNAPLDPTCNWLAQAIDGQWTSPNGGQRTCI